MKFYFDKGHYNPLAPNNEPQQPPRSGFKPACHTKFNPEEINGFRDELIKLRAEILTNKLFPIPAPEKPPPISLLEEIAGVKVILTPHLPEGCNGVLYDPEDLNIQDAKFHAIQKVKTSLGLPLNN